jgi:hypothetical protein
LDSKSPAHWRCALPVYQYKALGDSFGKGRPIRIIYNKIRIIAIGISNIKLCNVCYIGFKSLSVCTLRTAKEALTLSLVDGLTIS